MTGLDLSAWAFGLSPIWGGIIWMVWEGSILPSLIARQDILAEADRLWHEDREKAFDRACQEEWSAWYRSDLQSQDRWRRIRRDIMRRERARGMRFRRVG